MITAIEIENFKGIRERVRIELKPITLLFGPNSGGKSTILHAIQYAQEIFARHNLDVEQTESGGGLVDLGGFKNLVNQRDLSRSVCLRFESDVAAGDWDLPSVTAVGPYYHVVHLSVEHMPRLGAEVQYTTIEVEVAWSELRKEPYVRRYSVGINGHHLATLLCEYNRREVYLTEINPDHPLFQTDSSQSVLADVVSDFDGQVPTPETRLPVAHQDDALPTWGRGLSIVAAPFPEKVSISEGVITVNLRPIAPGTERLVTLFSYLLVSTGERLKDYLSFHNYLGPLRDLPPRNYIRPRTPEPGRWASGLAAWDELYNLEPGASSRAPQDAEGRSLIGAVSDYLGNQDLLGVGYQLRLYEYKELPINSPLAIALQTERLLDFEDVKVAYERLPIRRRLLLITGDGMEVQPQDVGIGISQLVPVVVLAVGKHLWSLDAIEQPELHLHPAVQVRLGDLFIHSARQKGRRLLIETHSEHLLLRLIRRIRETNDRELPPGHPGLTPSELSVVFVEPPATGSDGAGQGARVYPLRLDETGEFLDRWPRGFFEERAKELF